MKSSAIQQSVGNLSELIAAMSSDRTGIIHRIWVDSRESGESGLLEPSIALADFSGLPGMQRIAQPGGTGFAPGDALARAVFETIERYCCAFVDNDQLLLSHARSDRFLTGTVFGHYGDWQFAEPGWPFARFEESSIIHWVEGVSLLTGLPVMVPAMCAFVPYRTENRMEWLGPSVSTGSAAGWSWNQACVGGILEVLERDAFAVTWLHRLQRPRLRVQRKSPLGQALERYESRTGAAITFVDLTHDAGIPIVLALLRRCDRSGRQVLVVGSSAKPTTYEACTKAYTEAISGYERLVGQRAEMPDWRPASDGANLVDWEWHGLAYAFEEMQAGAEFLDSSPHEFAVEVSPEPAAAPLELTALLKRLKGTFDEIAAVDLTTREFRELDVCVVKVIVPEAIPLSPDHRYPWLGTRRLFELPETMGWPGVRSVAALNRHPHPFA